MGIIPVAPTPPTGNVYTYTSAAGADYEIEFTIEEDTGGFSAGDYIASQNGIAEAPADPV